MIYFRALMFLLLVIALRANADDNVRFHGTFESGQLQSAGSANDGFFVQTLPDPQNGVDYVNIGTGGAGPNSGLDTRVVASENLGQETVFPRRGKYFLRSAIYYDKEYSRMPHNTNTGRNKPRSTIAMGHDDLRYDFDEEGYIGFSIYTPLSYEHETATKGHQGSAMLLSVNTTPDSSQIILTQFVDQSHDKAHWWLMYNVNDSSHLEGNSERWVDLGPVDPDIGKWTDFVIRFRLNPFSVRTNPALSGIPEAKNQYYAGNKGILQVWKAEGDPGRDGNRSMVLKLDKVNTPIGLVPHEQDKVLHSFRIYKYGWHYNDTNVKGPVWFGFDEIRFGLVNRDGTGYSDVHPAGLACTDRCPGVAGIGDDPDQNTVAPMPPSNLTAGD